MIDDFLMGLALAIFGGALAVIGLPTIRRWRIPSLTPQTTNRTGRAIRFMVSTLAIGTGLPLALAGLAMVAAALAGMRIIWPI
jgi:peptidoglycan biosynthesis protein MviN/MurJ (putative lipid II flippase)